MSPTPLTCVMLGRIMLGRFADAHALAWPSAGVRFRNCRGPTAPGRSTRVREDGDSFFAAPVIEDQRALRLTAADLPLDPCSTSNESF